VLLNFIYLLHAAVALVLSLLLLFYPDWFTEIVTGVTWSPGTMADVAVVYARYTAVGLILIVLGTSFARQSASTRVRWVALVSMIVISLVGLAVSFLLAFQPLKTLAILVNAILMLLYLWILYFNSDEI
jgi:hypothetical protein